MKYPLFPRRLYPRRSLTLVFALLPLLLLSLLVTSCGGAEEEAEAAQPAEVRWLTFDPNSKAEQLLAEKYSEIHPNITFKREQSQLGQSNLDSAEVPDLMTFTAGNPFDNAVRQGQLADLGEVWLEAELEGKLMANLEKLVVNEADGQRYLLPVAFDWAGIYYNKAIFEQYGLTPPQTWDEFLQISSTLYNNAERALAIPGPNGFTYSLWFDYLNVRINGAEFHRNLLAGRERFDDPRVFEVLEAWRELFVEGYAVDSPQSLDDLGAINSLVRGDDGLLTDEKAAMVLMDTYSISQAPPAFREEFGFFPFPTIDPSIPNAELAVVIGYVVPANAANGAAAQYFLSYLTSKEAQELVAQESLFGSAIFAPARVDLDVERLSPDAQSGQALIQAASEVVPLSFTSLPDEMLAGFNTGYRRFLSSDYDPQPFIDALEAARQEAIEKGALQP